MLPGQPTRLHEALFLLRIHMRLFRPGLGISASPSALPFPIRANPSVLDAAIKLHLKGVALPA